MSASNPYQRENRLLKVERLVEAVDAVDFGADNHSERFYLALRDQTREWWLALADFARVHVPSEDTIAAVLAVYRERPALRAAVARLYEDERRRERMWQHRDAAGDE